jgi:hypothetical protein
MAVNAVLVAQMSHDAPVRDSPGQVCPEEDTDTLEASFQLAGTVFPPDVP